MRSVATVIPDRAGNRPLDYSIPAEMLAAVGAGSRVRVSVRTRSVLGTVIATHEDEGERALRPIESVIGDTPLIRPKLLEMAHWIADYYCAPLEAAMACVLPQAVRSGNVKAKKVRSVRILREPTDEERQKLVRRAPRQIEIIDALLKRQVEGSKDSLIPIIAAIPTTDIAEETGAGDSAFRALEKAGFVTIEMIESGRDPHEGEHFVPTSDLQPNDEQAAALALALAAIQSPQTTKPLLLHGVTGSGKTEVYLQAIRAALEAGKTALVLVPEISLTPQTVERFKARFSQIGVAVLHSHLSDGERYDEWRKIHSGAARIAIGARSAVFAPLDNIGIIIVDEEHESSYKQEESPRYNARDLAILRAHREPCAIILGSATPSIESWHNAQIGKYCLVKMTRRVDDRKMPFIRVVNLTHAPRFSGKDVVFAPLLLTAIGDRLDKGEQTILFLNRRGFSTAMQCPACGVVRQCPHCAISLTYHREQERLACHICGYGEVAPRTCPECRDPSIRHYGVGTQKVEETIRKIFPKARIARMDADAMSRKNAYRETLGAFKRGEVDILVGTQMIAKGLDFPRVTLVGIINADLGLTMPDFRAAERTFQLLTQVAGRAGRGDVEGEVFIQTFQPYCPAIQFARHGDYEGFVEQELIFREKFHFPPYHRMALITVRSQSLEKAEFCAQTIARKLQVGLPPSTICGDCAPAPLAKAKDYHRFQIGIRGPAARPIARHIRATLDNLPLPEDVFTSIDIDPLGLM